MAFYDTVDNRNEYSPDEMGIPDSFLSDSAAGPAGGRRFASLSKDFIDAEEQQDGFRADTIGGLPASNPALGGVTLPFDSIPESESGPEPQPLALPVDDLPFTPDPQPLVKVTPEGRVQLTQPITWDDMTPEAREQFASPEVAVLALANTVGTNVQADAERMILGRMETASVLALPLPEKVGSIDEIAQKAGMAPDMVRHYIENDPQYLKDQVTNTETLRLSGTDGYITKRLQEPDGAQLLREDAQRWSWMEKNLIESGVGSKAWWETRRLGGETLTQFSDMWRFTMDAITSARIGIKERQLKQLEETDLSGTGFESLTAEERRRWVRELDYDIRVLTSARDIYATEFAKNMHARFDMEPIRTGSIIYDEFVQPALGVVPSLALALPAGPAGGYLIATSYGAGIYNRAVDAGIDRRMAFGAALVGMVGTKYFGDMQLSSIRNAFRPRSPTGNWLGELGHGMLVGAVSNAGQSIASTLPYAAAKNLREGGSLAGFASDAWADRGNWWAEAYGGSMFSMFSSMLGLPLAARNQVKSTVFQARFTGIQDSVGETKLYKTNPALAADEINNAGRHHGGAGIVFASVETLEQGGLRGEALAKALRVPLEDVTIAKASGMELAVPVGNAAVFAKQQAEAGNAYYQDVFKGDPEAMSAKQILDMSKDVEATLKLAEANFALPETEWQKKTPTAIRVFETGLRAAGRTREEAKAMAAVFQARAERAAEQWGVTPEEWLARKDVQLQFDKTLSRAKDVRLYERMMQKSRAEHDYYTGRGPAFSPLEYNLAGQEAVADAEKQQQQNTSNPTADRIVPMEGEALAEAAQEPLTQPAITPEDNSAWLNEATENVMRESGLEGDQYIQVAEQVRKALEQDIQNPDVRAMAEQLGIKLPPKLKERVTSGQKVEAITKGHGARSASRVEEVRGKFNDTPSFGVRTEGIAAIQDGPGFTGRLVKWARDKGIPGTYANMDTGWGDIAVSSTSIRDVNSHKAGPGKLAVLEAVPALIRSGIYLETTERNDQGHVSHIFAGKVTIDGEPYVVGFVVNEGRNGKRYYNHELTQMKKAHGAQWPEGGKAQGTATNREPISSIVHKYLNVNPDAPHQSMIIEDLYQDSLHQQATAPEVRGNLTLPQYAGAPTILNLFKSHDVSTIIHELNHLFVLDLKEMVEAGKGGQEAARDLAILTEFAGGKLDRNGLEKIARGWERYFMDGRAPSPTLYGPFDKMRSWMSRIYERAMEMLDVTPSREVRAVFDRMLATDAEIEDAGGMAEGVGNWYDQLETIAAEDKRRMDISAARARGGRRRQMDARAGGRALRGLGDLGEVRRVIRGETANIPAYRTAAEAAATGGFDRAEVESIIGPEGAKEIAAKHGDQVYWDRATEKAADAEIIAATNGYLSVEAMLTDMAESPTVEDAAKSRIEKELRRRDQADASQTEQEGGIAQDDGSDAETEALFDEMEVAMKEQAKRDRTFKASEGLRKYRAEYDAMRQAVERHIGGIRMENAVDIRRYKKAEADARRAALVAASKNDMAEVVRQKKLQMLHHLQIRESMRARDMRAHVVKDYTGQALLRAMQADKYHPKVEDNYAEAIKQTATYAGFTADRKLQPAIDADTLILPTPEANSNVSNFVPDLAGTLPGWMLTKQRPDGFTSWQDFTYDQVKELDRVLQMLLNQGRGVLNAMRDVGANNLDELVAKSTEPMARRESRPGVNQDDRTTWGRILNGINKFLISVTIPENWFMAMDGNPTIQGKEAGINQQMFWKLRECQANKDKLYKGLIAQMQPHFDQLSKATHQLESKFGGKTWVDPKLPVPDILKTRRNWSTWDADMLLSIARNMGNDANLYAITEGYGFTKEQLDYIASLFSVDTWRAIQGIWDGINSLYPKMDAVTFGITNRHMTKEAARPLDVMTADGQTIHLEGGYFPLVYDPYLSDRAGQQQDIESAIQAGIMQNIHQSTKPAQGMLQERMRDADGNPIVGRPPLLRGNLIIQHLDAATHYISHADAVLEFDRLTRNEDWKKAYVDKFGMEQYRAIRNWIQDIARPDRMNNSAGANFMEKMRSLATVNALGLRFKTGLKQRLGLFQAAAFMADNSRTGVSGWKYIHKGIREIGWGGNLGAKSEKMRWVDSVSDYMAARDGSHDRELKAQVDKLSPLSDEINIPYTGRTVSKRDIHNAMFWWVQANDRAGAYATWVGAYEQALAGDANFDISNMTDAQRNAAALKYADAAAATQASSFQADLTQIQKDQGLLRFLSMFMSGNVRQGSRLMQYLDAYHMGDKTAAQVAYLAVREFVFPSLAWILLDATAKYAMGGGDDDDSLMKDAAWEVVETSLSPFPLVRELPSIVQYGPLNVPAVEGPSKAVQQIFINTPKKFADAKYLDALANFASGMGFVTGVPVMNPIKEVRPLAEAAGIVEPKKGK